MFFYFFPVCYRKGVHTVKLCDILDVFFTESRHMYTNEQQLIVALRKRNFVEADNLFAQGLDINFKNNRGETALYFFSENGSLPMMEWLIAHGADLNLQNGDGETPLFRSVKNNDEKAVDLLLNSGADVDIPDKRLISPVMQSVLNHKDRGVLNRLLEAMPDVNFQSENQTSPLLAAAAHNKIDFIKPLIEAGADPEAVEQLGQGVLAAAVLSFNPQMLREVIANAPYLDPNYAQRSGSTAMSLSLGMAEMTSLLLDIGGDPNAKVVNKMYDGMTLLMSLFSPKTCSLPIAQTKNGPGSQFDEGSVQLIQKMLDKGASVNVRADDGRNAGFYAAVTGSVTALQMLVGKGLDPSRPLDVNGTLPYDVFMFNKGPFDIESDEMLEAIRDIHSLGFAFERPQWDEKQDGVWNSNHDDAVQQSSAVLQVFLSVGFFKGIKEALNLGANANETSSIGSTIAHSLVKSNYNGMTQEFKKLLNMALKAKIPEEEKKQQLQELMDEARVVFDDLMSALNSAGLDWNAQDDTGNTPLHYAAISNNQTWAKYLLNDMSANPTLRNKEGLTPAAAALKAGHLGMFLALCDVAESKGYDVKTSALLDTVMASSDDFRERQPWLQAAASVQWSNEAKQAKNEEGQTAVCFASATSQHDVVRTLLKLKLDPNAQDAVGNTPLMHAAFNEDGEIMRVLRAAGADANLCNDAGQNAFDVADFVKVRYIHDALSASDLSELIMDLEDRILNDEEKMHSAIAQARVENEVRSFKDEKQLTIELNKDAKNRSVLGVKITDPSTNSETVYGDMTPVVVEQPQDPAAGTSAPDNSADQTAVDPNAVSQSTKPSKKMGP